MKENLQIKRQIGFSLIFIFPSNKMFSLSLNILKFKNSFMCKKANIFKAKNISDLKLP